MPKKLDLRNQKFGRLVAIKYVDTRNKRRYWQCKCDCGNILEVSVSSLRSGNIQSCGCSRINNLIGQKIGLWTVLEKTGDKGNGANWLCECECGNKRIVKGKALSSGRSMSCGCSEVVKSTASKNLKEAIKKDCVKGTRISNIATKSARSSNKTGVRGVSVRNNKFVATIAFQGKRHWLGSFDTLEEAARVRKEAEAIYYDVFLECYQNEYCTENK